MIGNTLESLDVSFKRMHEEMLRSVAANDSSNTGPNKYRRPLSTELEITKKIPFSSHCQKSIRSGTLFPSLQHSIQEKNQKIEENGDLYREATNVLKRGGDALHFEPALDDLIKQVIISPLVPIQYGVLHNLTLLLFLKKIFFSCFSSMKSSA